MYRQINLPRKGTWKVIANSPFLPPLNLDGQFIAIDADSVAVLDLVATASLVRFKLLGHRIGILESGGVPRAETYPACARFEFGVGR